VLHARERALIDNLMTYNRRTRDLGDVEDSEESMIMLFAFTVIGKKWVNSCGLQHTPTCSQPLKIVLSSTCPEAWYKFIKFSWTLKMRTSDIDKLNRQTRLSYGPLSPCACHNRVKRLCCGRAHCERPTSAPSVPSTSRTQTLGMSVQHIQTPTLPRVRAYTFNRLHCGGVMRIKLS
jgi:hypothetical protein